MYNFSRTQIMIYTVWFIDFSSANWSIVYMEFNALIYTIYSKYEPERYNRFCNNLIYIYNYKFTLGRLLSDIFHTDKIYCFWYTDFDGEYNAFVHDNVLTVNHGVSTRPVNLPYVRGAVFVHLFLWLHEIALVFETDHCMVS
jgi:hypothetical protein